MSEVLTVRPTSLLQYERCGYAFHLAYNLKIRTEQTSHALAFGTAGHKAALGYVKVHADGNTLDPVPLFLDAWQEQLDNKIVQFSSRDAKELKEIGTKLCKQFPQVWNDSGLIAVKSGSRVLVENRLKLRLAEDLILSVEPDVVAKRVGAPDGELCIPDLKFPTGAAFDGFAKVSNQLSAYQLTVAVNAPSLGLGNAIVTEVGFVEGLKKKDAQWHTQMVPAHDRKALGEYVAKVKAKAALIRRGYFFKQSGEAWSSPCDTCDFRSLCIDGDATGLTSPYGDVLDLVQAKPELHVAPARAAA